MKDPIVEEVRRARDAHAKQFNYDLDAICEDLRKREQASGRPTISLPPKQVSRPRQRSWPPHLVSRRPCRGITDKPGKGLAGTASARLYWIVQDIRAGMYPPF